MYLNVNHKLLTDYVSGGLDLKDVFGGAIKFKTNTQYVFSVEWKVSANGENDGIRFIFLYTDGSIQYVSLKGNQTTKARINYVTDPGKTISKISSSHGFYAIQSLIYNISLIEGNKPLQGFPVAEEDQTGANNVNLADGTKEFTIGVGSTNYTYKGLYVSKIKPNTVYYVNAGNIQNLVGNPDRYSFVLYNKDISTVLCPTLKADKNGGFLITYNNFTEQEGRLLCYAGIDGSTLGNSVKFTEVMLVEGFLPAPVWTPSFSEQQAEIKTITKTLTEIKAENGEISLRVNEVSERVEEAKQEAIVMKTEFDSQITQLKDSINLRVTKTDYDKNNQDLNQSIGNLQTSYNSISGTVSSLNTRLQTVEKAGYITTSQGNTLYASKKLENGNELISYINQDATNTTIKAKNINLNGAISANGNIRITTDGKLIAVNGQFTGKITATEGEIAGLKLSNNGLRSSDFNASSKVGSCYAKNGFSVYASGSGVLAPSTGALQAGIITAIGTNSEIIGLEIIAKNTSGYATLSKITALKLRAIDYVDDSKKMAPTAALIVEEGVSIFNGDVEVNGKSTFNGAVYFKNVQNVNGKSNYYLCIDRSTGQLYYR